MDKNTDIDPLCYADAAVSRFDSPGQAELVCYQVNRRFVDNEYSIPKTELEKRIEGVVYYSLDIGHHTGLIDCFEERLRCPLSLAARIYKSLPDNTVLKRKLRRAVERSEAYMNCDELHELLADSKYAYDLFEKECPDEVSGQQGDYEAGQIQEGQIHEFPLYVDDEQAWLSAFYEMLCLMKTVPDASIIARRRL